VLIEDDSLPILSQEKPTMTILRVGSNQKYAEGFDRAFGGKKKGATKSASSAKSAKKATTKAKGVKSAKSAKKGASSTKTAKKKAKAKK
jgi:hypothetical protein